MRKVSTPINVDPSSEVILFFHGLWSTPGDMGFVARILKQSGYEILEPKMESYGFQEDKCSKVTYEDWINEVKFHYVKAKQDYKHVHVGGLCIGGALTLALASSEIFDSENDTVISMSTMLKFDGWNIPFAGGFLFRMAYFAQQRLRLFPNLKYNVDEPFGVKDIKMRNLVRSVMKNSKFGWDPRECHMPLHHVAETIKLGRYIKKNLHHLKAPLFICHAALDDTTSPKNANQIEKLASSKITRKILLRDSYHVVTLDGERKRLAAEIKCFLNFVNENRSVA